MSNGPIVELSLRNPYGQVVASLADYVKFQGPRTTNTVGRAQLTVPGDFPLDLLQRGMLIDAWWAPYSGYTLRPWRVYEIQKPAYLDDERDLQTWTVDALDLKSILAKRRVRAAKGSTYADKEGAVEALMKAYASEQARSLTSAYGFTVSATRNTGPVVKKEASRANLLTVLQDLAKASAEAGTMVYFDVLEQFTASGLTTLLEVWTGEMGVDQGLGSPAPLILSKSTGTISKIEYSEDGEKEVNRVDVGGKGNGDDRAIQIVEDSLRASAFPGAVVEGWAEKSDTSDPDTLRNVGLTTLRQNNIQRKVTVTFTDSLAVRIGRDLDVGDRCLVHLEKLDRLLPARVASLVLTDQGGKVTVVGALEVFEVLGE
jgi:hypothetical protein